MNRRGELIVKAGAVALVAFLCGCATFVQKTVPGYAHDVPDRMHGLSPGPTTRDELRKSGWAFAETHDGAEIYVLGAPVPGVGDVEAQVTGGNSNERTVQFLRLKYSRTRLATYKELLGKLLATYGQPQSSQEVRQFELFEPDPSSDAPRPPSFIVHRWKGPKAQVVLAAGLEAPENLLANMQYQLFFMPADNTPPPAQP